MFAVTELCTGIPATDLVRSTKHLRPDEVLAIGLQLADALAAVHAVGVVYRDLHPGNVLIARGDAPRAWIFDFDHAQVSPAFYARLTERWATPPEERLEPAREKPLRAVDYVAPEVRAGAPHTPASDTFSLGLLLYRLLTGQRPFPPSGGEPTPPRKYSPACPTGLARVLLDMLSADPNERPSLAAVRTALADEQAQLDAEHDDATPSPATAPTSLPAAVEPPTTLSRAEHPAAAPANPAATLPPAEHPAAAPVKPATTLPPAEHPAETAPENPTAAAPAAPATTADTLHPTPSAAPNIPPAAAHQSPRPHARSSRVILALALLTTAAISIAIGRATVSPSAPSPSSSPATNTAAEKSASPLENTSEPTPHTPPVAEQSPPAPPPAVTQPEKIPARPLRPVRRTPVTADEATAAAARILPALRTCDGAPNILTVDLDITRGRGTVTSLNLHALTPDDPRYAWHACVQRHLERLRFPISDTAGHTRIRLTHP